MTQSIRRIASLVLVLAALLAAVPAMAADGGGKVNVNTASEEQLALLPRVGPAVAARIVAFREENGPFKKVEDLMLVRGVGAATYDLLVPYVTLSGDTTLAEKVRVPRAAAAEESGR